MRRAAKSSETFLLAAAAASLALVLVFRDFTVDDALVAVRYARNLAGGFGWRFDRHGVVADGVTPLPLPLLLAPLALGAADALTTFVRVRVLMGAAHAATLAVLVGAIARRKPSPLVAVVVVLTLLLAFPLAAYATTGMETPLAALLATAPPSRRRRRAAPRSSPASRRRSVRSSRRGRWSWRSASGCGRRRPRCGSRWFSCSSPSRLRWACALVRARAFGSPAPLALQAKPSDVATGLRYVAAALLTTTAPILIAAPRALVRAGRVPLTLVIAFLVHALVVLLVGGDWMPFARLFAPVLPSLIYAFVLAAPFASVPWMLGRAGAAFTLAAASLSTSPPELRHLWPARLELARSARPVLQGAERVATLDIGWPTLATDADLVDLAGLTDPEIAGPPPEGTPRSTSTARCS